MFGGQVAPGHIDRDVGVVAFIIWGVGYVRSLLAFSEYCRHQTINHTIWQSLRPTICKGAIPPPELSDEAVAELQRYHAETAAKYRRAARYPWLPFEPDTFGPRY